MTNTIHIMLDLETWGKAPGCDLRSIGACVFDPLTGALPQSPDGYGMDDATMFYIATDNPIIDSPLDGFTNGDCWSKEYFDPADRVYRKYALKRYPDTVQWWNDQSEEARAAFANPVDLREALIAFGDWLTMAAKRSLTDFYDYQDLTYKTADDIRLWSHGPAFDPPILAAAYAAVGLPVPWHYRAPRDTRTLFDVAGIDDHSGFMTAYNTGTAHHALDDAIAQAKSVCGAYQRLSDRERQAFYDGWNSRDIAAPSINAVYLSPHEAWMDRKPVSLDDDGDILRTQAIAAVQRYDDWTNQNEIAFTGWGEMTVPDGATQWRKNSGEALALLKGERDA